jgi:hypothetical protein
MVSGRDGIIHAVALYARTATIVVSDRESYLLYRTSNYYRAVPENRIVQLYPQYVGHCHCPITITYIRQHHKTQAVYCNRYVSRQH